MSMLDGYGNCAAREIGASKREFSHWPDLVNFLTENGPSFHHLPIYNVSAFRVLRIRDWIFSLSVSRSSCRCVLRGCCCHSKINKSLGITGNRAVRTKSEGQQWQHSTTIANINIYNYYQSQRIVEKKNVSNWRCRGWTTTHQQQQKTAISSNRIEFRKIEEKKSHYHGASRCK